MMFSKGTIKIRHSRLTALLFRTLCFSLILAAALTWIAMPPAHAVLDRSELARQATEAEALANTKIQTVKQLVDSLTAALAVPGAYDEAQRHIAYANDLLTELGAIRNRSRDINARATSGVFISPGELGEMSTDIIRFQNSLEPGASELNKKIGVMTNRTREFRERVAAQVRLENEINRLYDNGATILDNLNNYLARLERRMGEITTKGSLTEAERAALDGLKKQYGDLQALARDTNGIAALKSRLEQAKASGDREQALAILKSLDQEINRTYADKVNAIDGDIDDLLIQIATRQGEDKKNEELRRQAENLINQALALESSNPAAAAEMLQRAAKLLRDTGNPESIARAQRLEQRAEQLLAGPPPPPEPGGGPGDDAKKQKAKEAAEKFEAQARELERQGRYAEAADLYQQAGDKYKEAGDNTGTNRVRERQKDVEAKEKDRLRVAGLMGEAEKLLGDAQKTFEDAEKLLAQGDGVLAEALFKKARTQLAAARQKLAEAGQPDAAAAIAERISRLDGRISEKLMASLQLQFDTLYQKALKLYDEAYELGKQFYSEDQRNLANAKFKEASEKLEKAATLAEALGDPKEARTLRQLAAQWARDFKAVLESGEQFGTAVNRLIQVNPRGSTNIKAGDTVTFDVVLIVAGVTETTRHLIKTEDHSVKVVANNQIKIEASRIPSQLDASGKAKFFEVKVTVPSFMPGGAYPLVVEGYQNPDPKTNKTQIQPFLFYSAPAQIDVVSKPAPTSQQAHARLDQLGAQLLDARRQMESEIRDYEVNIEKLAALVSGQELTDENRGLRYTVTGTPWPTILSQSSRILQPLASTAQQVFGAQESEAKRLMFGNGNPIAIVPGIMPGSGLKTSATEMARRWTTLSAAFAESGHAGLAGRVARLEQRAHDLWVEALRKIEGRISAIESAAQNLKNNLPGMRRVLTLNGATPVLAPEFSLQGMPGDVTSAIQQYLAKPPAANHPVNRDIKILQGAPADSIAQDTSIIYPSAVAIQSEAFEMLNEWFTRLKARIGEKDAYALLRDGRQFNGRSLNLEANRLRQEAWTIYNQIPQPFNEGSGQDIVQDALVLRDSIIGSGGTETIRDEYGVRTTTRSGVGLRYYYRFFDEVKNISPSGGPYEGGLQTGFEDSHLVPLVTIQDSTGRTVGGALYVSVGGSVGRWERGHFTGPKSSAFLDAWSTRIDAIPTQMPEINVTQYYVERVYYFYNALTAWSAQKILEAPPQAPPLGTPWSTLSREQMLSGAKQAVEQLVDAYARGDAASASTVLFHPDITTNTGQNLSLLTQAFHDDRRNFNSITFQRPLVFDAETVVPEESKVTITFHWYRTAYFARSGQQWKANDRTTITVQYGEWPIGPAMGPPAGSAQVGDISSDSFKITQRGFRITEIVYGNRDLPMIGIADVSGRLTVGGGDVNGTTVTTPTTVDQGTFAAGGGGGPTPSITSLLNALDQSAITKGSSTIQYVVIITGTNFGSTAGTVTFGSTNALASDIISWADTEIQVKVPSGMTAGSAAVAVTSSGGVASSNTAAFTVIPSGTFTLGAGQSFAFASGSVGANSTFPNTTSDLNANIIGGNTFIAAGDPGANPPATVNGRIGILGTFNAAGNISAIQQASGTAGTTPDVSADPGEAPPQASQNQPVGTIYLIKALSGQFARIRFTSVTGTGTAGFQFTFEYVFNNADAGSTF